MSNAPGVCVEDLIQSPELFAAQDISFQRVFHGLEAFLALTDGHSVFIFSMSKAYRVRKMSGRINPCRQLRVCSGEQSRVQEENDPPHGELFFIRKNFQHGFELIGEVDLV